MKLKNLIFLFTTVVLSFGFFACSDDDEVPALSVEKESYILPVGSSDLVVLHGGSGDFDITLSNEIVEYNYYGYGDEGYYGTKHTSSLAIEAKSLGTTIVTVKDNKLGNEVKFTVNVVLPYVSFYVGKNDINVDITDGSGAKSIIEKDIEEKNLINTSYIISLIKDEAKTLYVFSSMEKLNKGEFLYKGNYKFEKEQGESRGYLILDYKNGTNDKSHKYKVDGDTGLLYLNSFFELGWINPKMSVAPPVKINLIEDFTNEYKTEYPQLNSATLTMQTFLKHYSQLELSADLFK